MSDWYQIESNQIIIQVTTKGAELKRLFNKVWNKEMLWSGDEKIWNRTAPILFPIVGALKDGEYTYADKNYSLGRHGFIRDMNFNCTLCTENKLQFKFVTNKDSYKIYPFLFDFTVEYFIHEESLKVLHTIKNLDKKEIPFSFGLHPAFELRGYENYEIKFDKSEEENYLLEDGLLNKSSKYKFPNPFKLAKDTFVNDALIIESPRSKQVEIIDTKTKEVVKMIYGKVPFLGVWGPIGNQFISIEPWFGAPDTNEHDKKLENKLGIMHLKEGSQFTYQFEIQLTKNI